MHRAPQILCQLRGRASSYVLGAASSCQAAPSSSRKLGVTACRDCGCVVGGGLDAGGKRWASTEAEVEFPIEDERHPESIHHTNEPGTLEPSPPPPSSSSTGRRRSRQPFHADAFTPVEVDTLDSDWVPKTTAEAIEWNNDAIQRARLATSRNNRTRRGRESGRVERSYNFDRSGSKDLTEDLSSRVAQAFRMGSQSSMIAVWEVSIFVSVLGILEGVS
ncbi:unnamed protein product [Choristocarpus tenellus]